MLDKQQLFDELLRKKGITFRDEHKVKKTDREGSHPLSFSQQRIHFLQQFEPGSLTFNDITILHIKGNLDIKALEKAFYLIIQRHEVMQMRFPLVDGKPVQLYCKLEKFELPVIPVGNILGLDCRRIAEKFIREYVKPFDLSNDNLYKIVLLKLSESDFILIVNIHHIIFDGWSKGILLDELKSIYEAIVKGHNKASGVNDLKYQYIDYVYWQKEWVKKDVYKSHLDYWVKKLEDGPQFIELPTDYCRPAIQTSNGSFRILEITGPLYESVRELAKKEQVTLFMLLLAVFNILLMRYTGQQDILVGSPVAGRQRIEFEKLIGLFVNMVIIRSDLSGDPCFTDLLKRIKKETIEAYNYQDVPFEKLIEKINPKRNLSYSPLFQVMFVFQNMNISDVSMPNLEITPVDVDYGFSQVDLSLTFWEEQGRLKGSFEYNTDLFAPETINRMINHYKYLMEQICQEPGKRISQYSVLSQPEKIQLIEKWNNTGTAKDYDISIKELFEKNLDAKKENVALFFNGRQMSYAELNEKANKLGWFLRKHNVKRDVPVGICIHSSFEFVISVLGILKAGGAFLPVDPEYPPAHIKTIVEDSRTGLIITVESLKERFSGLCVNVICLDSDWRIINNEDSCELDNLCRGQDLACVIFTSGSTGKPKGVLIENRNIVNLLYSFIECYKPDKNDRIMPVSSIASASFVGELLPLLVAGGAVVLANKSVLLDTSMFLSVVSDYGVTILSTVPSMLNRLNGNIRDLKSVRLILSGGEALHYSDVDKLAELADVVNGYGLTETSVCSTCYSLKKGIDSNEWPVPIGKPIRNNRIYILDDRLDVVPVGCPGEIYISGAGVSRGYLNDDELTEDRYLKDPFFPGERMFKTGDKGIRLPDGNIRFIDRMDRQVQVHGFRVEPGEIEKHLKAKPDIQDAVVASFEIAPNDKRLVAYFVAKPNAVISSSQLREWLGNKLPEHMIPSFFEQVDEIPVNPNGKADLKRLPAPKIIRPVLNADYEEPSTKTEKIIASVWSKYLHIEKPGVKDNFFDLGGHSLLVMQICDELKTIFKKEIKIIDIFKYPTIHSLAQFMSDEKPKTESYNEIYNRAKKQREVLFKKQNTQKEQ